LYAQSIVEQRLVLAAEELGFQPEYHSTSEIDEFETRLRRRYEDAYAAATAAAQGTDDQTKAFQIHLTRALCSPNAPKLTRDEVRFIQNERALAMSDAAYFLTRYYWIKTPQAIQRFTFLPGQKVYFDVVAEMESAQAAIEMIVNKARQHGISTETEGLILHRIAMYYGVNGVVASAQRPSTGKMAQMMFLGYDRIPWWLRPLSTRRVESDQGMLVFGSSESGVSFQHGNQRYGIARGDTVKVYHLSEVASYPNAQDLIEASLFKCVHPHPDVFGVLESTAEGDAGWWYDTYWHAKSNWRHGRSRLCPLFLPWFLGTDKYPTETWLRTHPIPQGWDPRNETRQMVARAKMYVDSAPVLGRVLGSNWELPRHQAWYWEVVHGEARDKGIEKLFFQEMPTDDRESFQGSFDNVFGREIIAEAWSKRKTAYSVYGIIGQSIEDRHEPDQREVDYGEQVIPVSYYPRRGEGEGYRWELWPLQWEEPFENVDEIRSLDSHMGKLFVWHPPEPGYDYSIGVDTSNGIGQDSTCIAVSRRGRTPQEQDVQVAEFRSNRVSHVEAYAWVMAIAAYYSRYMEETTAYREPYVSIEQIRAVGDTCQLQMKKMGYTRFHRQKPYHTKVVTGANSNRDGWYTTAVTRPILTDTFVILVQNGWYKVNSPYTMREMTQWEVHYTSTGKDKYEHSSDETDDGIFANAMAAFCPNDTSTMAERSKKQFAPSNTGKLPQLDMRVRGGIVVNPDYYGMETGAGTPRELRIAMRRWE
jgi:hypothetical protein